MRTELSDAIESARTATITRPTCHAAIPQRRHSREEVVTLLLAVVRELPEEMSVRDLREELEG